MKCQASFSQENKIKKSSSLKYGKYPKILYTKVSDKVAYASRADPDQTVTEGAVWSGSTLFAIPLSILRNICIKGKI